MVAKSVALFWCVVLFCVSAAIFWSGIADDSWLLSAIGYLCGFIAFGALLELFKRPKDTNGRVLREVESAVKELKAHGIAQDTFREYLTLPDRVDQIIGDYSEVLGGLPERPILHPISMLPHPKEDIEAAIKQALGVVQDANLKNMLLGALLGLRRFVPEHEITEDSDKDSLKLLGIKKCPRCSAYLSTGVPKCSSCEHVF